MNCWDKACLHGKYICCLDCQKKESCSETCDQYDCETWITKEKEYEVEQV